MGRIYPHSMEAKAARLDFKCDKCGANNSVLLPLNSPSYGTDNSEDSAVGQQKIYNCSCPKEFVIRYWNEYNGLTVSIDNFDNFEGSIEYIL